ncbi:MAG: response regulator transcription factor [Actinomycetota bacterium]
MAPAVSLREALDILETGQIGAVLIVIDPAATRALLAATAPDAVEPGAEPAVAGRPLYLTPIERRVLALVAGGKANKQVAFELGISPLTVKNHLARIRARFGAADRTQVVALAIRAGLLD